MMFVLLEYEFNFKKMKKIFSLLFICLISCSDNNQELISSPQKNDIYLFEEAGTYSPMKVDEVKGDSLYLLNSKFVFQEAMPEPSDILDEDFDRTFFLIYEKKEIQRLFDEGKIVEVYR